MSQKRINVSQIESGKDGLSNLGTRLNSIENINLTDSEDIDRINEALMATIQVPSSVPLFFDVSNYTVLSNDITETTDLTVTAGATSAGDVTVTLNGVDEDITVTIEDDTADEVASEIATAIDTLEGYSASANEVVVSITGVYDADETAVAFDGGTTGVTATVGEPAMEDVIITLPDSKEYKTGKNHLQVWRNGVYQSLSGGDYTEESTTEINYSGDVLEENDVLTFMVGDSSKLDYDVSVSYYSEGENIGLIETITYTGDVAKTVTYDYNTNQKITEEVTVEDGVTTTRTFSYDGNGKLTDIAAEIS